MSTKKNYSIYSLFITLLVIIITLLFGYLPPLNIGDITFKKINILSDIIKHKDSSTSNYSDSYIDTTFLAESIEATSVEKLDSALNTPEIKTHSWNISTNDSKHKNQPLVNILDSGKKNMIDVRDTSKVINIEEFDEIEQKQMSRFYTTLTKGKKGKGGRPIRIAVLGDSFIEGDIITADLREQMQAIYGGRGVGFVPFASTTAKFRATIKHSYENWGIYNVLQKKSTPDQIKDKFFISGIVSTAKEGAHTRFEGVGFRKGLKKYSTASLLFINEANSTLDITVNDSINNIFAPQSSPNIQQIDVTGNIKTLDIKINNPEGFFGYGVLMNDNSGICVDNFSLRGNSGMALFGTNSSINAQLNKILDYDLIILQYGLNALSANILNYDSYGEQLSKIIGYVKSCFPNSSIMLMGVGDRSTQIDGAFVTMPAVKSMIATQRRAAKKTNIAFWNTFDAMGGENSMVRFVERKWAAKDYTHISYQGGKYIAKQLFLSLFKGHEAIQQHIAMEKKIKEAIPQYVPTTDTVQQ